MHTRGGHLTEFSLAFCYPTLTLSQDPESPVPDALRPSPKRGFLGVQDGKGEKRAKMAVISRPFT